MEEFKDLIGNFSSLPYLFIGSGISRRYIDTNDWIGLLNHFISMITDNDLAFERYRNLAKQELRNSEENDQSLILPKVASLIEIDFNEMWFNEDKFAENRIKHKSKIKDDMSPFKVEVADYIEKMSDESNLLDSYKSEIDSLINIADRSINGVITTNYDLLIENLFVDKDYDCYVGQEDLIFSSLNGVREIFKIHGCCTQPESIVITYEDYIKFREKNSYIAAKLLTAFIEHPIIFLGYSIEDTNIINILESIGNCLTEKNIDQLSNRLFFVERNKATEYLDDPNYIKSTKFIRQFANKSIPMTKIEVNDYSLIYDSLLDIKAKYNPRLIKMMKDDIYDMVVTNKSSGKIVVTTHIEDKDLPNVDVVVGVGLKNLAKNGIIGISTEDIFKDLVVNNFDFLSYPEFKDEFIENALPEQLARSSYSLPIFKYIDSIDINELHERIKQYIKDKKNLDSFLSQSLKDKKEWKGRPKNIDEVINKNQNDIKRQMILISILDREQININDLESYLISLINKYEDIIIGEYSTDIRRLIKIYDFLKYKK